MTHKELCALAVAWLQRPKSRNGPGCLVAVSETANAVSREIPDAIGWRPFKHARSGSTMVEVKTSRADFLADAVKPHRAKPETGLGTYRYYMAPAGVIDLDDLPPRWGLIEVSKTGRIKVRAGHVLLKYREHDNWKHEFNQRAEVSLLAMCLARVGNPQLVQDKIRAANNRAAKLERMLDKARRKELP